MESELGALSHVRQAAGAPAEGPHVLPRLRDPLAALIASHTPPIDRSIA